MNKFEPYSVAVLANCTHASIAETLRRTGLYEVVNSFELYSMPVNLYKVTADSFAKYDFILTIEHGEKFGELSTAELRNRYREKVISLPTPFFSGAQPDITYMTYKNELAQAPDILGDYHSALILADCLEGYSDAEVIERYVGGAAFDRFDLKSVWDDSYDELRRREANTDIVISDYIEMNGKQGQIFLSFNHPAEGLIAHIVRSFVEITHGDADRVTPLPMVDHVLYQDVYWPIHPFVAKKLGIMGLGESMYKRAVRFGSGKMSIEEFATKSCAYFRKNNDAKLFAINTPSYIAKRAEKWIGYGSDTFSNSRLIKQASVDDMQRQVILTHFGRSGSTVLAKLLEQHSNISWHHEIFSLLKFQDVYNYSYSCDEMVSYVEDNVCSSSESVNSAIVGYEIKLMNFIQNPQCNMIDFVGRSSGRAVFIILRRRNVLRRILSVYKAMKTSVYHLSSADSSYRSRKYAVDMNNLFDPDTGVRAETLPDLISKALRRENEVISNYNKFGIQPLILTYEDDIEIDPKMAYRKILSFLGVGYEDFVIDLVKTSNNYQDEVENYDEVILALKDSEFSWML